MGPRCSSAETQVCHRSYIIAARETPTGNFSHDKNNEHPDWMTDLKHTDAC
jgi:hypothetical protein